MLSGGSGDQNLCPLVSINDNDVEDMLSRVRSMLVFSVENRGPKMDTSSGLKKADMMTERWKAIFSKYDRDSSGTLVIGDVRRMVRRDLKIAERLVTDPQISVLFDAVDKDGNGQIDFHEFLDFVQQPSTRGTISEDSVVESVARGVRLALRRNKIRVKDLEQNFHSFDESGDVSTGELGPNDMVRFFRKAIHISPHELSDKNLRIAFFAMDDDGSGKMSLDELVDFLKYCNEEPGKKEIPARVPGLIGGMRGIVPERGASSRPGTTPGQFNRCEVPFCLNGRDLPSAGRLNATTRGFSRSDSAPALPTLAQRAMRDTTHLVLNKHHSSGSNKDTASEAGDTRSESPRSVGGKSSQHELSIKEPPPKKRVWNGKLPGKCAGGYMLLKGAHALNAVEDRLFEAGIDVRGHYHKLGRDRPS